MVLKVSYHGHEGTWSSTPELKRTLIFHHGLPKPRGAPQDVQQKKSHPGTRSHVPERSGLGLGLCTLKLRIFVRTRYVHGNRKDPSWNRAASTSVVLTDLRLDAERADCGAGRWIELGDFHARMNAKRLASKTHTVIAATLEETYIQSKTPLLSSRWNVYCVDKPKRNSATLDRCAMEN